ncbi:MAG TPA: 2-dehydropantoate 2-reductase [Edaphobacter sp.]|jgi:2-dehydropantoate 2-reductase|nr:2-dehydropantoate 2-reductase [Edaphobacter sp.]
MARIAIVGVGAIGGVTAALLQQANGHELLLCTRRPLSGLSVDTPDGTVNVKAIFMTDPSEAFDVDWVVVATKAYDVAGAATWLERLACKGAPVAVLQNGIEHRERFAPYVATEKILPVMVDCPAERHAPDRIRQRGVMHLKVPDCALGRGFVELFAGTPADAAVVSDFQTVIWRKLCFNAAGVLSALLMQPAGVVREESLGEAALQIIRECAAVARAEGANLEENVPDVVLAAQRAAPPDSINSMLADRQAGRPVEIDARNGVIVRLGRKHGIATPANNMAVALMEALVHQN